MFLYLTACCLQGAEECSMFGKNHKQEKSVTCPISDVNVQIQNLKCSLQNKEQS